MAKKLTEIIRAMTLMTTFGRPSPACDGTGDGETEEFAGSEGREVGLVLLVPVPVFDELLITVSSPRGRRIMPGVGRAPVEGAGVTVPVAGLADPVKLIALMYRAPAVNPGASPIGSGAESLAGRAVAIGFIFDTFTLTGNTRSGTGVGVGEFE
jgi:hypothetical protein